ncbi:helix-turn-helix domain-containing protein [Phyllobacterium myrsinacearum]|uniref:XRE family transcriptional regulator n=1 Tax=Phyllobacterium myrsinacearum TaxID=28101 RepID=A0A2S9JIH4_9HYPH|nr:helix-turn-helix transcriptional regulator [Phyllobacterium myrsinacearum]PRD52888.1 XRE family transcriptional regulator [Phyllobacterium myrsinacearum]PWV94625.1 DNA-binding XRE family transcriptional regulator [Phyllobacterium myrsinacearum]RZS87698.1 DNA-binding XRE family transcriptional regulator [Phyllobacterium myrsinacearum]RZV07266.1 DNA-binding XRE family transcriptional regulator [Phyllobacterium myrsinacearum]
MESFASNLRLRTKELGIHQADVARRAGLSEKRYSNYVTGRREPDLATVVRIAKVLQTTPDRLLSFGEETDAEPIAQQRIRAAIGVLSPDDLETVAIMVEALASKRHAGGG